MSYKPSPSPSALLGLRFLNRCPVCFVDYELTEFDKHLYSHYNYCEYGHYEEFDLYDPRWPKCKNENMEIE